MQSSSCFLSQILHLFHVWQQDLESALQDSTANWKIVVGHHTIRSIGHHGETNELKKQLLPLLEVANLTKEIEILTNKAFL